MLLSRLRGTTEVKAAIPTMLQPSLFIDNLNIPNTLRTIKGMEKMPSKSSLTAVQLKFQKESHAMLKLSA
jgi:hypothetical protein